MASNKEALRKWSNLDKATQEALLANVFCVKCAVTTIVDYEIVPDKYGIVLKGKCKKCGHDVRRLIEDD